ncbi:unnamed protein product [Chironomus riparius]|uniref:UBX domain-containing protein 1 n=1 Tax=Chironomus riparius TaxID=315576 RepID=A0A9N9RLW8_9DIPT|nr:unnamed protein product [Chironomus riparius]
MDGVNQLMEMGFLKEKAEYALKISNNNVEQAMEWLLVHNNEDLPIENVVTPVIKPETFTEGKTDESSKTAEESPSTSTEDPSNAEVKSIKCEDCNKLFRSQLEVEFHATKSGHMNFSESTEEKKPLTEEEKKQQLALIDEKIKVKRAEREKREKEEALEREKLRIKSGKDMTEVKRKMEEDEMKKIVEERKREKQEEKAARDRVRAQIEADKAARRLKAGLEPTPISPPTIVQPVQQFVATPPKDYKETRIQIRLPNGSTLIETFNKQEQLAAVRLFVQLKQGEAPIPGVFPFSMMTSFPRKVFNDEDFEKSLEELQLVPSATIMVTKNAS